MSFNFTPGVELTAARLNQIDSTTENRISQNEHNIFELFLENFFAGKSTPFQGLFFDGFSDTSKTDSVQGVDVDTANKRLLLSASQGGSGADGDLTVPSGTTTINTIDEKITASASSGQKDITVDDGGVFAVGDEVFVHQSQGGTGDGVWEFAKIASIATNVLTMEQNLANSYQSTGGQVIEVPQFADVTIESGGILTAASWNSTNDVGGILVFRATGTVDVQSGGKIDMKGKGFFKGERSTSAGVGGKDGDSSTGDGAAETVNTGPNNGSGGSGSKSVDNGDIGGAGGAGHVVAGDDGIVVASINGLGGDAQGEIDLTIIFIGAGGGGGGSNGGGRFGGDGGNGGGIIFFVCNILTVTSTGVIDAGGQDGSNAPGIDCGGGGGGAGGSIFMFANTITAGTDLITALKGLKGLGNTLGGDGGDGSDGRIAINSSASQTGTTDPTDNDSDTTIQGLLIVLFFWQSIKTTFQQAKKTLTLWVVRSFLARFNLDSSIAVSATTLTISGDQTGKFADTDTIDIYEANNFIRERKTLTATPSFGGGVTTLTFTPAIVESAGFDTNAFVERVDVLPQVSLVDFEAVDDFKDLTFVKSELLPAVPKIITANGLSEVDTAFPKFGSGSLLNTNVGGDFLSIPDSEDFNFGGNDFTIDFLIRFSSLSGNQGFVSQFGSAGNKAFLLDWSPGDVLSFAYSTDGTNNIAKTVTWAPTTATYFHLEVSRNGSDLRFFIDGVQQGATQNVGTDIIFNSTEVLRIGGIPAVKESFDGNMDEIRISNIARHTAGFTPEVVAYTADANTKLLIHCDGVDASTVFIDDVPSLGNEVEDEYSFTASTAEEDFKVKLNLNREDASLEVFAKLLGVSLTNE